MDNKNACYGGTAALMNSVNWVESSSWDGRLAIVVMVDIAIYAAGPARPTGGAGAVALLIGPNAALEISHVRQNYFRHTFDFYKPDLSSEYPTVDGPLSIKTYFESLDKCYQGWRVKHKNVSETKSHKVLENLDHVCFHCPFAKLVQKSFGRLLYNDLITCPDELQKAIGKENFLLVDQFRNISSEASFVDKNLEKAFVKVSNNLFAEKCLPTLLVSKNVGNMYTPSVYGCLLSLLGSGSVKGGEEIGMFSYGSGVCATFYTIKAHANAQLHNITLHMSQLKARLQNRHKLSCDEMEVFCAQREKSNSLRRESLSPDGFVPSGPLHLIEPGASVIRKIDHKWRRFYQKAADCNGNSSN